MTEDERTPQTMYGLVFPGQGAQRKGMGAGLFEEFADLTARADEMLGYSVEELCGDDPDGRLRDTRYAQPALYFVNALLGQRRLAAHPRRYGYFAGHSLGEFNALVAGGILDLWAGLELVRERAELMARVTDGAMVAVTGLPCARVEVALRAAGLNQVHVASRNSDQQVTVAGDRAQLRMAVKAIRTAGAAQVTPVAVSGPFHTPLMAPAGRAFARTLRRFHFSAGHTPVVSSVTGEPFAHERAAELLSRQIVGPVEWVRAVRTLRAAGVGHFEEVNGATLTGLIEKIK